MCLKSSRFTLISILNIENIWTTSLPDATPHKNGKQDRHQAIYFLMTNQRLEKA